MTDISDEELERRMRAKLFASEPSGKGGPKLGATELKIAEKLMGKSNAQRLAHSDRPFRYKPVVMVAEFYEHPYNGWRIDVIEDGERRSHMHGMTEGECLRQLRILESKGASVRRFETEWMKTVADGRRAGKQLRSPNQRSAIMERLKEFRL